MTRTLFTAAFQQACARVPRPGTASRAWEEGCPLCVLVWESTYRYLRALLNEYTLAPDIHERMALARGFCNTHAWMLHRVEWTLEKDGMGTAILYHSVLKRLQEDLEAGLAQHLPDTRFQERRGKRSSFAARIRARLQPAKTCLVCEHVAGNERFALMQLLDELAETGMEGEIARLYQGSAGACLPHFLALLEQAPSDEIARWLTEVQRDKVAVLVEQLAEYERKHDVRYKEEPMGAEQDSWIRAIEQTVGKREIPGYRFQYGGKEPFR